MYIYPYIYPDLIYPHVWRQLDIAPGHLHIMSTVKLQKHARKGCPSFLINYCVT